MAEELKARGKGPKLPAILVANDLLEGDVIFRTGEGWTRDPAKASVASTPEAAALLEAEGHAALSANLVVDPYLVPVRVDPTGFPVAQHFREAMRQKGPSIHPDMGKQAEFATAR